MVEPEEKNPSEKKLQHLLRLEKLIYKSFLPWKTKVLFHRFLFPSSIEILKKDDQKKSVLFIAPNIPAPDRGGTDFRTSHILQGTVRAGYSISFLSLGERTYLASKLNNPDLFLKYERSIKQLPINSLLYGLKSLEKVLRKNPEAFCGFYAIWPKTVKEVLPIIKRYAPDLPIIYDMVDYHALRLKREADLFNDLTIFEKSRQFYLLESQLSKTADLTIAISESEKEAFLQDNPDTNMDVLGNFFEPQEESTPGPDQRDGLLFLGSFFHQPNKDAVRWFAQEIFPLIKEQHPDVIFHVIGENPPEDIQALHKKNHIEIHGWVPDLQPILRSVKVFVAPLRYGAGVKGKIGLANIHGIPVITTRIGAEGMGLTEGKTVELAETPQEFLEKTHRLLTDNTHWLRISEESKSFSEKHFSVKTLPEKIHTIFTKVGIPLDSFATKQF